MDAAVLARLPGPCLRTCFLAKRGPAIFPPRTVRVDDGGEGPQSEAYPGPPPGNGFYRGRFDIHDERDFAAALSTSGDGDRGRPCGQAGLTDATTLSRTHR